MLFFDQTPIFLLAKMKIIFKMANVNCYTSNKELSWDRTKTIGHGDGVCDFKVHIKYAKEN